MDLKQDLGLKNSSQMSTRLPVHQLHLNGKS